MTCGVVPCCRRVRMTNCPESALMQRNSDGQIALFVRDEKTGRLAFNAQALKALGITDRS